MIYVTLFAIATIADIVTTNVALSKGGREANGIIAWFMDRLGSLWWLPKALLVVVFYISLKAFPDNTALSYGILLSATLTFVVAIRNYLVIRREL